VVRRMESAARELEGFTYRAEPSSAGDSRTLLLLHGTGGDENDLIPLGHTLAPTAALLSPRGRVLEQGAPRFFRRLAEGVFDLDDLRRRTGELATFVANAAIEHELDPSRIIAVGFSNGANIAASLLLRRPGVLRGAVLLSPMVPFEPSAAPDLAGTVVFMGAGRANTMVPQSQVIRLAEILREAGAEVALHWEPGGHEVSPGVVAAAQEWLARAIPGSYVLRPAS
jgi:phospholipase/carboxylesterase